MQKINVFGGLMRIPEYIYLPWEKKNFFNAISFGLQVVYKAKSFIEIKLNGLKIFPVTNVHACKP